MNFVCVLRATLEKFYQHATQYIELRMNKYTHYYTCDLSVRVMCIIFSTNILLIIRQFYNRNASYKLD
jgi:hypothetical protein